LLLECGVPVPSIKKDIKDNGSIKIMIEMDVATNKEEHETKFRSKKNKRIT
jgi:hypothetical protein